MHDAHMRHDMTSITTLLSLPPDLVERDRVRRQALRVGAIEHPGLAPLRSADFAGAGLALTWAVPADSHAMDSGDDAIAVLAPIAAGLALLHDAGVAHGGVTADAVHVSGGRGLLTGWRPGGSPADDVADLIGLLEAALPSGSVGADVVQLLVAGVDPDPQVRPSMARVASVLDSTSRCASPPISPPAQRRARLDDALPPAHRPARSRRGAPAPDRGSRSSWSAPATARWVGKAVPVGLFRIGPVARQSRPGRVRSPCSASRAGGVLRFLLGATAHSLALGRGTWRGRCRRVPRHVGAWI